MFLPYKDENPVYSFPILTVILIVLNFVIYVLGVYGQPDYQDLIKMYGFVPCNVNKINITNIYDYKHFVPFISHMFLHVNIIHVASNMLFLWIFGNNIEDVLGVIRFYAFYIICGIAAALTYYVFHYTKCVPIIGASGAVSGLLGGYVVLFPTTRIRVWFIFFVLRLPAWFFILVWFVIQLYNLYYEVFGMSVVAWSSHIGGFIVGFILIWFFQKKY